MLIHVENIGGRSDNNPVNYILIRCCLRYPFDEEQRAWEPLWFYVCHREVLGEAEEEEEDEAEGEEVEEKDNLLLDS